MRTTSLPCISALNEQPTPQYAQVVITLCSACPICDHGLFHQRGGGTGLHARAAGDAFRIKEIGLPPAETLEANPRPSMVRANVPCTSSQARTQREHTMHLAGSKAEVRIRSSFAWL